MKNICIIIILAVAFFSCKIRASYYYKQGEKEEVEIKEYSDSAAYFEAFKKFEISKKVYDDMKDANLTYGERPISFILMNDKHEDITYSIVFSNQDSLEKSISKMITNLPSSFDKKRK